jgi:hypothetical protein
MRDMPVAISEEMRDNAEMPGRVSPSPAVRLPLMNKDRQVIKTHPHDDAAKKPES